MTSTRSTFPSTLTIPPPGRGEGQRRHVPLSADGEFKVGRLKGALSELARHVPHKNEGRLGQTDEKITEAGRFVLPPAETGGDVFLQKAVDFRLERGVVPLAREEPPFPFSADFPAHSA